MNKEILRRNIEGVIMQPAMNKRIGNGSTVEANGIRELDDTILVKTRPTDSNCVIRVRKNGELRDFVQDILDSMPDRYRDKLVTLRHYDGWLSYAYLPVFDTETQKKWDKELDDYLRGKKEWCDRNGCD